MNTKRVIQYFATIAATGDLAKKKDSKMKVGTGARKGLGWKSMRDSVGLTVGRLVFKSSHRSSQEARQAGKAEQMTIFLKKIILCV